MSYGGLITSTTPTSSGGYGGLATKVAPLPVRQGTPVGQVFAQIPQAAQSSFQQGVTGVDEIMGGEGPLQAVGSAAKIGSGVAGVFFSPLAPVTNLIGKAIHFVGDKLADTPLIKNYAATAPESDLKVLDALQNLGTVAMSILGAKAGEIKPTDIPTAKMTEIAQHPEVIKAAQELVDAHNATKPTGYQGVPEKISHADYAKSQGYEPITPDEQLPTIQMGPKSASELPTIQAESANGSEMPGYQVEPIKSPIQITPNAGEAQLQSTETPVGRTAQTLKPIEGTGELKTRGLSQNVEASAIEKRLTDNFGDLPEYRSLSMKDQASKAAELIVKNPEDAKAIALGNKAAPKGLLPESVMVAVEHKATTEGDIQTLKDLANSRLSASATTMGQRIRTLGERDMASPLDAIREVQQAREGSLARRGATIKTEATARISESIRKTNTVKSWADFVSSIEC